PATSRSPTSASQTKPWRRLASRLHRDAPRGVGSRRLAAGPPAVARPAGRALVRVHLTRAHRPRAAPSRGGADAADPRAHSRVAPPPRLADARLRRADAPRPRDRDAAARGPHARLGAAAAGA